MNVCATAVFLPGIGVSSYQTCPNFECDLLISQVQRQQRGAFWKAPNPESPCLLETGAQSDVQLLIVSDFIYLFIFKGMYTTVLLFIKCPNLAFHILYVNCVQVQFSTIPIPPTMIQSLSPRGFPKALNCSAI